MTTRLYYTDPLLHVFDARVVSCLEKGTQFEARLDQTAFYPTSGGQPFDTGRLGAARVLDVLDADDGDVVHVIDARLPVGEAVRGAIDWARRFDHMQQHTGQHILSAAFDRRFGVRTTSFHLGAESATIDLAREVTAAEITQAEREANQVVWENRPVRVRFATEEDAARLPLRKEPVRTGLLRLVEVVEFDLSACGGTHVPQTGMIGIIAVAGWERFKGATRLTFVCGRRALDSHGRLRDTVTASTRALSVLAEELPAAIERMHADLKDAGRAARKLHEELAGFRARGLRQAAEAIGPHRGVLRAQPETDAALLKALASAIVSEPGFIAVLVGEGRPAPVVVARSSDVALDVGHWMKRVTADLGGRGGGRPELAQGGIDAPADNVLEYARRTLC